MRETIIYLLWCKEYSLSDTVMIESDREFSFSRNKRRCEQMSAEASDMSGCLPSWSPVLPSSWSPCSPRRPLRKFRMILKPSAAVESANNSKSPAERLDFSYIFIGLCAVFLSVLRRYMPIPLTIHKSAADSAVEEQPMTDNQFPAPYTVLI